MTNTTGRGPRQITYNDVVSTESTHGGLTNAPGTSIDWMHFLPDGSAVPFELGDPYVIGTDTRTQVGGSGDNFRDDRPSMVSPQKRGAAFVSFDYDVTDATTLQASVLYGHQETEAPFTLPVGWGSRALPIFQDNAFLPDNIRQAMIDEDIEYFLLERTHGSGDIARDYMINRNHTLSATVSVASTVI